MRSGVTEMNLCHYSGLTPSRIAVKQPVSFLCEFWKTFLLRFDNGTKFGLQHFARPINFSRPICDGAFANLRPFLCEKLARVFVPQLGFDFFDGLFDYSLVIVLFRFRDFFRCLLHIRPRDFAVTTSLEQMRQRGMEFFWLQFFAIERTKAERNWIVWRLHWLWQAELHQFTGKPLPPVFFTAERSALATQVAAFAQVVAIAVANQHAHVFEVRAFATA
jgi:hypothetical protein